MTFHVNIGGAWKEVESMHVNVGGSWKEADSISANIGGVWKDAWSSFGNTWTYKANMPAARSRFSAEFLNGKIYLVGGWDASSNYIKTLYEYDIANDSWSTKSSYATEVIEPGTAVVGNRLYVFGGFSSSGTNDFYVRYYNPSTDSWTHDSTMPVSYSYSVNIRGCAIGNNIYMYFSSDVTFTPDGAQTRFIVYNTSSKTWNRLPSPPPGIDATYFGIGAINSRVYLFAKNGDVYEYYSGTWTLKSTSPYGRKDYVDSCVLNGRLYIINDANSGDIDFPTCYAYDPSDNSWRYITPYPLYSGSYRTNFGCAASNSNVYMFGGRRVGNFTPINETLVLS